MSTPIIEAIDNVNQTSLNTVFAAVAADPTARDNLSQSDRNIDKVSTNVGVIEQLNSSEEAIRKMLCRREGRDPANFANLDAVAADQGLMQAIAARQESSKVLARSQKASAAAAASQTAMQEVAASQTAMQEVAASQTAMTEIDQVDFAVRAIMCGTTSQDPTSFADADAISQDAAAMSEIAGNTTTMNTIAASQTAMQEVAASQTAMQEVIASQTARDEVFASQTAMQEVAASQTAMQEVAASQTAMQEVAASQTAISEVESASNQETFTANVGSDLNTSPTVNNAGLYVAELSGGGGSGEDNSVNENGNPGGDTVFNQSTAEGGAGGGTGGPEGGTSVALPDVVITATVGGGGSGGGAVDGAAGYDGGFVKALISNSGRQSLSLTVGRGGEEPASSSNGQPGVAVIYTPNAY